MTAAQIAPAILVPLVLWRLYVRTQHDLGRQRLRLGRLGLRIALCAIGGVGLTFLATAQPAALPAAAGGGLVGALLAVPGLKLTRWEMTPAGSFYTPSPLLGVGITLTFLGHLVYRCALFLDGTAPLRASAPVFFGRPLTLVLAGLTIGYHLAYASGVFARGRHVA